jgi:hypothetical protein
VDPANRGSLEYEDFSKNISRVIKLSNPELYSVFKFAIDRDQLSMKRLFKGLGGA